MSDDNAKAYSAWPPRAKPGKCHVRVLVQDAGGLTSEAGFEAVDWETGQRLLAAVRAFLASPAPPVVSDYRPLNATPATVCKPKPSAPPVVSGTRNGHTKDCEIWDDTRKRPSSCSCGWTGMLAEKEAYERRAAAAMSTMGFAVDVAQENYTRASRALDVAREALDAVQCDEQCSNGETTNPEAHNTGCNRGHSLRALAAIAAILGQASKPPTPQREP